MDWLNKARQFLGNLIGGASKTIGNIAGGVARNVGRAEQEASRFAQQAARNVPRMQIPQAPRFQLPQINIQAPRIQMPQAPRIQAPKIDFGAVSRALGGVGQGLDITRRTFAGQQLTPQQQSLVNKNPNLQAAIRFNKTITPSIQDIGSTIRSGIPALDVGLAIKEKGLGAFSPQEIMQRGPLQNFEQLMIKTNKKLLSTPELQQIKNTPGFLGKTIKTSESAINNPQQAITGTLQAGGKAIGEAPGIKQFNKTQVGKILSEYVVNPTTQSFIDTFGRVGGAQSGQKTYADGLKGYAQLANDIVNIGSAVYSGNLAGQLGTKGTAFLKTAAKLAPRLVASGAGQNIITQLAQGKKINEIDYKDVLGAAVAYTTLGIGLPGLQRAGGGIINKLLSGSQGAIAGKVAQGLPGIPGAKAAQAGPIPRPIAENVYPIQPGVGRIKPPAGSVVDATPGLGARAEKVLQKVPSDVAQKSMPFDPFYQEPGNIQKYLLDAKGNPIGAITGEALNPKIAKNTMKISDLYVTPQARTSGAGSKLLQELENTAKASGIQRIYLDATQGVDNFYLKNGYTKAPGFGNKYEKILKSETTLPITTKPIAQKIPQSPQKPIFETVPESAMRPKAPKGVESIPPGRRERGFISTVKESPQTEATTLTLLKQSDGTYKVKPNRILEKQANERIASNVADAKTYAITQTDDQAIATATQLIKYFQAKGDYGQAAEVASQAARTLTDAGRTIQAATLYNKLNPDGILQYASSKMQKVGKKLDPQSAEILTNMAKKIEAMPDGEPKQIAIKELLDEVGRTQGSALPDKIITLWKAGLLTSPITTAGNLTSNTIKQVVKKTADDPIAAIVDMTLGLATGKRTKTFTLRGEVSGAEEGLKRGIKYFKTGYDPRDPISKLDQKDVYFSKGFFGKAAKGYTDTVFRSLGAQDQPYFYAALKNTLYDQAIAAAKNKGIKGASREQFIKNFINNPDTKILDQATEEARTAVFQNKTLLGDIASRITQSNNPTVRTIGQFIMPFSRVPSAVATEIFERTPLGAAKEIVKQIAKKSYDQRALSTAISKSTTGTLGLMGLGYALDRGGNINLAMPTSQAEQNLWQQEGRQPFSIKIGDKYYSMNYIQPFGSLIAMGAQYNRSLRENGKQQDALAAAFAMGAKAVTEQSFLRGVSGALGALQDPTRYAERFVEQTAGSIIPNAIRTTARAFDPLQREVGTAGEAIIAGIPGLRQTLQPKVDIFGQPIARTANPIDTLFNPLRPTTAKSTPETQEIRRLFDVNKNIIPSEIDKNVFGKENPINQQQINNLKTTMGNAVLNRYQQIMSDPRYVQLSDDQKAKALKDAKDAVIQGEKFKFAIANNLPYTTADKLDKDTADYLNGIIKDTIAATLPKPPKVKVSKARRGRTSRRGGGRRGGGTARIRISKAPRISRISIKTPKISASKISKGKKLSFKVPKPKATARKSIKIKTG